MGAAARRKEFLAGLLFVAIGAGALLMARDYRMGTATAMGPGFVPSGLALLLIALGAAAALRAARMPAGRLTAAEAVGHFPFKAAATVLGGVALFAVLMPALGLVPATLALVLLACLPRMRATPVQAVALAAILAALAAALFVYGLGMPFRLI